MSVELQANFLNIHKSLGRLRQICEAEQQYRPLQGTRWTLHQHLEHLSTTGRSTPKLIDDALRGGCAGELNEDGQRLFQLGYFPRGETQAPDFAIPRGARVSKIAQGLQRLSKAMHELEGQQTEILASCGRSEHPLLGGLSAEQWLIFLDMHQRHHLAIIEEGLSSHVC